MATKCLATQELLLVYCLVLAGKIYALGELLNTNGCTCVGYTATYQCTFTGKGGTTLWSGDKFDCPLAGNEIRLRHVNFIKGTHGQCNGFDGQSLPMEGNSNHYSSQLMVPVTSKLNGTTIECEHENLTNNMRSEIGQAQLTLTTVPFDPPNDTYLADAGQGYLLFSWSAVANSCASLQYEISSTCGVCNITNTTSALCSIDDTMSHDARECSFKIRSIVCDNLTGRWSDPINVPLKVPEPPIITGVQANYDTSGLTGLIVNYRASTKDLFNISRDSYVHNFTIEYSDNLTNLSCTLFTTSTLNSSLPQTCLPSMLMNNNITVTIAASNRLGKGKEHKTVIAATNEYVNINTSSKRIICERSKLNILRSCSASYGECGSPKRWQRVLGNATKSLTVVSIDLHSDNVLQDYCYEVTATIDKLTVIMSGKHDYSSADCDYAQHQPTVIILASVLVAVLLMTVVGWAIIAIVAFKIIYRKYHPLVGKRS